MRDLPAFAAPVGDGAGGDARAFGGGVAADERGRRGDCALGGDACAPVPPRVKLDEATIARIAPVSREEVRKGGLRLAKLLDKALT